MEPNTKNLSTFICKDFKNFAIKPFTGEDP